MRGLTLMISPMRPAAPAACETSFQTSDNCPSAPAPNTANSTNCDNAPGHPVGDHLLRAEPEHDDDAAESEEQRGRGHERARLGHRARGLIGAVGGVAIAVGCETLRQER